MKRLGLAFVAILLLIYAGAVGSGQGAPAQIEAALLDLGARLGRAIALSNLSDWRWEQTNFNDSALGCPTVTGTGGAVLGYKFTLTYSGVQYDYRVAADDSLVVYCGTVAQQGLTTAAAAPYSNRLCPQDAADGPYLRSRINVGIEVEVEVDLLNLRGQPNITGQLLFQLPRGTLISITAGPDCVAGYVWWLVNASGQTGYIAEAGDGIYSVGPAPPAAMPHREALNVNLVPFVRKLTEVRGNFQPLLRWSGGGDIVALPGAAGSDSVWLYDLRSPVLTPQWHDFNDGLAQIAFQPNSLRLLLGGAAGTLHLWQLAADAGSSARETLYLNAHAGAVSAIAFSPAGDRFVSAGPVAYSQLPGDRNWAAILWDMPTVAQQALLTGHQGLIRALAYSPDGGEIASGADDGRLRFWHADSGAVLSTLELGAPITALDYSPDGSQLAIGIARTADNLVILDTAARAQSASYTLPTNSAAAVDFSPNADMLAVGATEGIFTVWDTRTRALLLTRETAGSVGDLSFSPDGTIIAVATEKYALAFYGVPRGSG